MINEDKKRQMGESNISRFEIYVLLRKHPVDREVDGRIEYVNYSYYPVWKGKSFLKFLRYLYTARKVSKIIKVEWRRL